MKIKHFLLGTILASVLLLSVRTSLAQTMRVSEQAEIKQLASHTMPLSDRYAVPSVNNVFRDNILLTIAYMRGIVQQGKPIDWNSIEKPFTYSFTLQQGQTFAFHDGFLPQFDGKVSITTHADFGSDQSFKSDGYLIGDGVCHLASIMSWVAKDAGLKTTALVNHDFANIPDVPKQYGVAIYDDKNSLSASAMQNLYITNNKEYPVTFTFTFENNELIITATHTK
jgi:hypothetical protein